jgi:hypothetical protein
MATRTKLISPLGIQQTKAT